MFKIGKLYLLTSRHRWTATIINLYPSNSIVLSNNKGGIVRVNAPILWNLRNGPFLIVGNNLNGGLGDRDLIQILTPEAYSGWNRLELSARLNMFKFEELGNDFKIE